MDDVLGSYIRRRGFVEPLSAKFCNGTTTTCAGLSQWGSQGLAEQGYDSVDILRYYYGDDIELVVNAPIQQPRDSWPGRVLRRGDYGPEVLVVQTMANRIGKDYPAIPAIWPPAAVYDGQTERAVQAFQRIFGLTPDGAVGKATWNKMVSIYNAVNELAELRSEGQRFTQVNFRYPGVVGPGARGEAVRALQYMLAVAAEYYQTLNPISVDGVYGEGTRQAVEAFQRAAGLAVDGVAGEQTWVELYRTFARLEQTRAGS